MAIFNSFLYVYQRVNGGYGRFFSLKSQKMTPWRVFCGKTCRSASPQVPIPKITICTNHPQSFPLGGFLSHGVPPVIIHFLHVQRMFPWKSTIPKSRKMIIKQGAPLLMDSPTLWVPCSHGACYHMLPLFLPGSRGSGSGSGGAHDLVDLHFRVRDHETSLALPQPKGDQNRSKLIYSGVSHCLTII